MIKTKAGNSIIDITEHDAVNRHGSKHDHLKNGHLNHGYLNNNLLTHERAKNGQVTLGKVTLVGAGPGDPDLMTIKGMKALQKADVVVYDRLANHTILKHAPQNSAQIYVGKRKCHHAVPQDEIIEILIRLAKQGKQVVRLKGGDPYIFGRGGEELTAVTNAGIECDVVPGITAALGCAAATKIPLTHRDYAHALVLITGHRTDNSIDINWSLVTQPDATVVFYMGLSNLDEICAGMIDRGVKGDTPMAVIGNGTFEHQKVVITSVAELPSLMSETELESPALIIKGDVIKACSQLGLPVPEQQAAAPLQNAAYGEVQTSLAG